MIGIIVFLLGIVLTGLGWTVYAASFVLAPILATNDHARVMRWAAIGLTPSHDDENPPARSFGRAAVRFTCFLCLLVAYAGPVIPTISVTFCAGPGLGALAATGYLLGSLYSAHVAMHVASGSTAAPRHALQLAAFAVAEALFTAWIARGALRPFDLDRITLMLAAGLVGFPVLCIGQSFALLLAATRMKADRVSRGVPWALRLRREWLVALTLFMYVCGNYFVWGRWINPNLRPY